MENRENVWDMGTQTDAETTARANYAPESDAAQVRMAMAAADADGSAGDNATDVDVSMGAGDNATDVDVSMGAGGATDVDVSMGAGSAANDAAATDMDATEGAKSAASGDETLTSHACPRGYTRYTWRTGDTLASVASRYGIRPEAVSAANPGIVFTRLNFGDEICIPFNKVVCPGGGLYTVRRGDTFTSIAKKYGVPVYAITELNPYVDPTALQIGQQICVPIKRPPTPPTPVAPSKPVSDVKCGADNISILMPMGWSYGTVLTRYGISYNALKAANPDINIEAIPTGQKLCIPPAGTRRLCAGDGARSHIIERGETLDALARRFNTSVSRLLRLNPDFAPTDFIAGRVICAPK